MEYWLLQTFLVPFRNKPYRTFFFLAFKICLICFQRELCLVCTSRDWAHCSQFADTSSEFLFCCRCGVCFVVKQLSHYANGSDRWHFLVCQIFHNPQYLKIQENMSMNVSSPKCYKDSMGTQAASQVLLFINQQNSHFKKNLLIYNRWELL